MMDHSSLWHRLSEDYVEILCYSKSNYRCIRIIYAQSVLFAKTYLSLWYDIIRFLICRLSVKNNDEGSVKKETVLLTIEKYYLKGRII